jgi:hypothetical protein
MVASRVIAAPARGSPEHGGLAGTRSALSLSLYQIHTRIGSLSLF